LVDFPSGAPGLSIPPMALTRPSRELWRKLGDDGVI
jgi:hypothetical protein